MGPCLRPCASIGALAALLACAAPRAPAGEAARPAPGAQADALFASGRDLVRRNAGDAPESSRAELEEGVRRVEQALYHGYPDEKEAWEVLVQAYDALRSRVGAPEADAAAFLAKEGECYRRLAALDPPSAPEWLLRYVATLGDRKEQLAELRQLVWQHPRHVPSRKMLAARLCEDGLGAEGLQHAVVAAEQLTPASAGTERAELLAIGRRCGGEAGAERIWTILERRAGDAPR